MPLKTNKAVRLSEILLERKLITPENLEVALKEQAAPGKTYRRLGEIFISLGFVSEQEILKSLSEQLGFKYLTFSEFPKVLPDNPYPSVKFLKQYKLVPIGSEDNVLKIAMTDPLDKYAIEALRAFRAKTSRYSLAVKKI